MLIIVQKEEFIFLFAIGKGSFGKVWKARHKKSYNYLAIKQMNKAKIIDQKAEDFVMKERLYLSNMRNPFIVNIICSFQDLNNLYLGLELFKGGDLRYHLINHTQTFTESQLKFLVSNLIMGLEYIHSKNIIHRDIKPENILFDYKGYAHITDFNISCKKDEVNNLYDISGTPVYMAPESISQKFQDFSVDFYSLGIVCYECIMGRRPYEGTTRHDIKKILNNNDVKIERDDRISEQCQAFINGLLEKNPTERLGGHSDALELKENLFFKGFNWDVLKNKKYISPIAEIINFARSNNTLSEELFDAEFCNKTDEIDDRTKYRYSQIMAHKNYPDYFRQYTFLSRDALREIVLKSKMPAVTPKRHLQYSMSSENVKLPVIKSRYSKNYSNKSNGGMTIDNQHSHGYKSKFRSKKSFRYPSNENSLRDYYEYKLNKYKQLLRKTNNYGGYQNFNPYFSNMNYSFMPNPMNMNPYQNRRNGNDIYNDVLNGLQKKIYRDIFGGMEDDYDNDRKRKYNGIPNQYQINNYFAPPYMMPGMGMPNPFFMYPYGMFPPMNQKNAKTQKHTDTSKKTKKSSKKSKKSKKSSKEESESESESESSSEESSSEDESESNTEQSKKKSSEENNEDNKSDKESNDDENSKEDKGSDDNKDSDDKGSNGGSEDKKSGEEKDDQDKDEESED